MSNLGWIRDLPDHRDYQYQIPQSTVPLPVSHTLQIHQEPYDQEQLGSCTSNATASALRFLHPEFEPSRLFIYYNTRLIQNTVAYDSGASIRDSFKALASSGTPQEYLYPYKIQNFKRRPSATAYKRAMSHQALQYQALSPSPYVLNSCLFEGYPFVFGFSVYTSFYDPNPTKSFPSPSDGFVGGHAVLCVGYESGYYICLNSWGSSWGAGGYFKLPTQYLTNPNLADDFWTLRQAEPF